LKSQGVRATNFSNEKDLSVMAIRAVIFDIGGVLEITPSTGWQEKYDHSRRGWKKNALRKSEQR